MMPSSSEACAAISTTAGTISRKPATAQAADMNTMNTTQSPDAAAAAEAAAEAQKKKIMLTLAIVVVGVFAFLKLRHR